MLAYQATPVWKLFTSIASHHQFQDILNFANCFTAVKFYFMAILSSESFSVNTNFAESFLGTETFIWRERYILCVQDWHLPSSFWHCCLPAHKIPINPLMLGDTFLCKQEARWPNKLHYSLNSRPRNWAFGAHHWNTHKGTPVSM